MAGFRNYVLNIGIGVRNILAYNMDLLKEHVLSVVNDGNSFFENAKTLSFIGYLFLTILTYIFILNIYANRLSNEYIQTKRMLTIIPFEVIKDLSDFQKVFPKV